MFDGHVVCVTSYAGYKGEERPMAFHDRGRKHRVLEIQDRWVESDAVSGGGPKWYFQVKGDDGKEYLLSHDPTKKQWCLEHRHHCIPQI